MSIARCGPHQGQEGGEKSERGRAHVRRALGDIEESLLNPVGSHLLDMQGLACEVVHPVGHDARWVLMHHHGPLQAVHVAHESHSIAFSMEHVGWIGIVSVGRRARVRLVHVSARNEHRSEAHTSSVRAITRRYQKGYHTRHTRQRFRSDPTCRARTGRAGVRGRRAGRRRAGARRRHAPAASPGRCGGAPVGVRRRKSESGGYRWYSIGNIQALTQ